MPLTWTCETVGSSTNCAVVSTTTARVQDLNVTFGLGVLIVAMFLMVIGFMFNHLNNKKPWL